MSEFKACADAIRYKGFDETADLVEGLAAKTPKMYAAVSVGESGYGDEVNGFDQTNPRVFLTRKSAKREAERLVCNLLRTLPLRELIERLELSNRTLDPAFVSTEMTRILGRPMEFPAHGVDYWNDPRCEEPLLPAETSDEQAMAVAKLMKTKFFKVVSVPCHASLTTPEQLPEEPRRSFRQKTPVEANAGLLWFMNLFRRR